MNIHKIPWDIFVSTFQEDLSPVTYKTISTPNPYDVCLPALEQEQPLDTLRWR